MAWNPGYQYRNVCVTINLPDGKTHADYDLESLRTRLNPVYLILGRETGSGTGRPHFQGYFQLGKKVMGQKIDKIFRTVFPLPISVHFEAAKGTAQQNKDYCSKEDKDPFTFGEPEVTQGKRSDLAAITLMAKDGASDAELIAANPGGFLVHQKGLKAIRQRFAPERTGPSNLLFLWGPSGTGKTSAAYEGGVDTVDRCKISGKRFLQGYTRERATVLFDDFNYESCTIYDFLEMTDRWPATMDCKNGEVRFAPKNIIFTSNVDPMTWFQDALPAHQEAYKRRIEEFGEVRYMGDAIPRGEKPAPKLTDFFAKINTATPTVPSGAGASSGKETDGPVDLTETSDEEDHEDQEAALLKYAHDTGKRVRDDDEHSDASNDEYHGRFQLKKTKTIRRATRCRTCFRPLKKTARYHDDGTGSCKNCT